MSSNLKFLVRAHGAAVDKALRDVFLLTTDKWDDFGHEVQFHLAYVNAKGVEKRLGTLKILQKISAAGEPIAIASRTKLSKSFAELGDEFISLGQEEYYYKDLFKLFGQKAGEVLDALRDIAWHPSLATDFQPTSAYRNAMMRENGAYRSQRFGRAWATGEKAISRLAFNYSGIIDGADAPIDVEVAFDGKDPIPGRIVGIIGRNAVGKTRFLASLGADLAQIARSSEERIVEREQRFPNGRPLFTRIIAISYSAFDRFKRPPSDASNSYVYCGIRSDSGGLSRTSLVDAYRRNQARIRDQGRQSQWTQHMRSILGGLSEALTANLKAEIENPDQDDKALSLLSSGQSILAHFVTALLAWIQPNTLVLFDEPETHLHPNAVASLFLALADILVKFDSYAIIATHSPVVIREIPAKRVLVFQREGNVTTAEALAMESFGESITELTRHVFETIEIESLYRKTLKELAQEETAEEVLARFDKGLSLSAQAYLLAQYAKQVGKKQ